MFVVGSRGKLHLSHTHETPPFPVHAQDTAYCPPSTADRLDALLRTEVAGHVCPAHAGLESVSGFFRFGLLVLGRSRRRFRRHLSDRPCNGYRS